MLKINIINSQTKHSSISSNYELYSLNFTISNFTIKNTLLMSFVILLKIMERKKKKKTKYIFSYKLLKIGMEEATLPHWTTFTKIIYFINI